MTVCTELVETLLSSYAASKPVGQVFLYIIWRMASDPEGTSVPEVLATFEHNTHAYVCRFPSRYLYIWYEEEERKKENCPILL